jgi:ankyrin repeat protein
MPRIVVLFFLCVPGLPCLATADDLLEAAYRDDSVVAKQLIDDGADVNAKNRYGVAPLSLACQNGNADLVEILLKAGADPNTELPGGETVLLTAARTGRVEPVKALLAKGARVDTTERKGQNALMWAAAEGHTDVVELLIQAGADPDITLDSGFNAMFFAARNGHSEAVKSLLKAGVDVTAQIKTEKSSGKAPPEGTTALRLAVENGHFDLAALLLEAGADPNEQSSGHTTLHVLTWVRKPNRGDGDDGLPSPQGSGDLSELQFARLIVEKYHADVNAGLKRGSSGGPKFGTKGATPFLLAARTADLEYLKLLKELGADTKQSNDDGTTPLLAACGVGSLAPEEEAGTETEALDTVAWLLELGSDINETNRNRETAMHGAAYRNRPKLVAYLAENGAEIERWNQKNKPGWTPLLIASGFRPGNFKPSADTIEAIESVMRAAGVEPPPAPERPLAGKNPYQP